jgi:uncharacterized membrane protein YfcA
VARVDGGGVSGIGDLAIAAAAAFAASVLGGVAGYGVGMVIPIFLAPVVGIAGVVPTTTIATLFTGFGRLWAFRRALSWPEIRRMSALGLPMSFAGAWILTVLEPRQLALFLGLFLIVSVPVRRLLERRSLSLGAKGTVAAGAAFGLLSGATPGTNFLVSAILMATGLKGAALIGSIAAVGLSTHFPKIATFAATGLLDMRLLTVGIIVGIATLPGGYVAKWLVDRLPMRIHTGIMDVLVIAGGANFLWAALRG